MNRKPAAADPVARARDALRARGMRWTPQRRALLEVLVEASGHVTGAELIERARQRDPETTPSTVYRTLDVLEDLGPRVAFPRPRRPRGVPCLAGQRARPSRLRSRAGRPGRSTATEARAMTESLARSRGFAVNLSHLTVSGLCADCRRSADAV